MAIRQYDLWGALLDIGVQVGRTVITDIQLGYLVTAQGARDCLTSGSTTLISINLLRKRFIFSFSLPAALNYVHFCQFHIDKWPRFLTLYSTLDTHHGIICCLLRRIQRPGII